MKAGRLAVGAALPAALGRVMSVGRLDLASEGLLLLSDSGAAALAVGHLVAFLRGAADSFEANVAAVITEWLD